MRKITVTKALCSLRGFHLAAHLGGCASKVQYQPSGMWRNVAAARRTKVVKVADVDKIYKEQRDHEDLMIQMIEQYNRLPFIQQCGLWLLSHVEPQDVDLVWCLIHTSRGGAGSSMRFDFGAAAQSRCKIRGRVSWKDEQKRLSLKAMRELELTRLRQAWGAWKPRLEYELQVMDKKYHSLFRAYEKNNFFCDTGFLGSKTRQTR